MKKRYKGHKLTIKNLCFTAIPAIVFPLIDIMPIDEISKIGFTVIAVGFVGWQVLKISLCEEKEMQDLEEKISTYEKYRISQKILNSLVEIGRVKRNLLKREELRDYRAEVLLYSAHEYIEEICSNIKSLISNITDIDLDSLSISFIYQYPANNSKWKWITRKNSTINRELHDFVVDEHSHSYFNYIITNNFSTHFEHNKERLVREGHYWISESDKRFSILGSIASYKMSFIKNEITLVVGYIVISTYGRTFVEKESEGTKVNEFNDLLTNKIIPSYRSLIETELGFMAERHCKKENRNCN